MLIFANSGNIPHPIGGQIPVGGLGATVAPPQPTVPGLVKLLNISAG